MGMLFIIHFTGYLDIIVQKDVVLMLNGISKYNISILFDAISAISIVDAVWL